MNSTTTLAPSDADSPVAILVAEDDEYDRLILQQVFQEIGFSVRLTFVTDGEDLLDYLKRRNAYAGRAATVAPSLLLMDLNMPRLNGNDALRQLRSDAELNVLPVVIMSTSDDPQQIAEAYSNGANAYMAKPGGFPEFVALLTAFCAFWLQCAQLPPIPQLG